MRSIMVAAVILAGLVGPAENLKAMSVSLAWDASPESTAIAFNVYYGPASGEYTNMVTVGSTNFATLPDLVKGGTYYIAATAVDAIGLESDFSEEVVYEAAAWPASVSLGDLVQVHDGQPKQPSVTTSPAGLAVDLTYNGSSVPPTEPGSYQVTARIAAPDFAGSASATLTIAAPGQALVLDWPATTNPVTVYESTNLTTWTEISTGGSNLIVLNQPGAHFFRATIQEPDGVTSLPLSIRRP